MHKPLGLVDSTQNSYKELMTITLLDFAERLRTHDDAAMAQFKAVLLRDARDPTMLPEHLELATAFDVAHFLAIALVVASQSNGKDELQRIKESQSDPAARLAAFEAFAAANPYQTLQRTPKNELVIQKDIPVVELDASKLAGIVEDAPRAFRAMRAINLSELMASTALTEALASRVSHPTKLSAPAGKGGFLKTHTVAVPEGFESVTEEDFLSRETATLSCNAAFQKMWVLMLPLVTYQGQSLRLAQLLAQDEVLATEVQATLEDMGIGAAGDLIAALRRPATGGMQAEPQVFAGDLPHTERLSVLAPYGMFSEMWRAKAAVSAAYTVERDERVADLDVRIAHVTADLEVLAKAPASTKAEKQTAQLRKKELMDGLRALKNERKALSSKYLNVPSFSLMFGGSVPRNVAMDLDTSLHGANVLVSVPSIRKPVSDVSNKVFSAKTLLYSPRIRLPKMPACLADGVVGARFTKARQGIFLDLIVEAMTPLQTAREEWATRAKELAGDRALSASAQGNVADRDDAYGLFIKGDPDMNQITASNKLRPLIKDISAVVKGALVKAFSDMPASYDEELLDLVTMTVLQERA